MRSPSSQGGEMAPVMVLGFEESSSFGEGQGFQAARMSSSFDFLSLFPLFLSKSFMLLPKTLHFYRICQIIQNIIPCPWYLPWFSSSCPSGLVRPAGSQTSSLTHWNRICIFYQNLQRVCHHIKFWKTLTPLDLAPDSPILPRAMPCPRSQTPTILSHVQKKVHHTLSSPQ